jgi:general secretion pathway protein G
MKRNLRGFTLLELLVVLLILGMLSALVAPKYFSQVGKSQTQVAKAQITAFGKALDQYRLDTGHYPTTAQGLAGLFAQPSGEAQWQGPYLAKAIPPDPWGNGYIYNSPGTVDPTHDYEITSYGKDGQPGGAGDNADVTSW